MTARYRTAFAVPSGFATTSAVEPRTASAAARAERKAAVSNGAPGRSAREVKAEIRAKSAAA